MISRKKNKLVIIWLRGTNGCKGSTDPSHLKKKKIKIIPKAEIFCDFLFWGFFLEFRGNINKLIILPSITNTPIILEGTARRIPYAHKKYHSGIMCSGLLRESTSSNPKGSPRINGAKTTPPKNPKKRIIFKESLIQ